jgi:hypothetical protein
VDRFGGYLRRLVSAGLVLILWASTETIASVTEWGGGGVGVATPVDDRFGECFGASGVRAPVVGTLIGVNYFDSFYRLLRNGRDKSYRVGFAGLAKADIPFIRFTLTGFWPEDLELPLQAREVFFQRFDGFIRDAKSAGIRLIPTVFWNYASLPDYLGEPLSAWGELKSKTRRAMSEFVDALMRRYRDETAIIGWEFSNEANAYMDLPGNIKYYKVDPARGTPRSRGLESNVVSGDVLRSVRAFAELVATANPRLLISSGFHLPRTGASKLRSKAGGYDSAEQFRSELALQNPAPLTVVSGRLYPETVARYRYRRATAEELIGEVYDVAQRNGQIPFVGEFGVVEADKEGERGIFRSYLNLLASRPGGYAALWVYDFDFQRKDWNVTNDGPRSYQLDSIAQANRLVSCRQ